MANEEIRALIKKRRLYQYEVARQMGIHSSTLCRLLRFELPDDKKEKIIKAIESIQL